MGLLILSYFRKIRKCVYAHAHHILLLSWVSVMCIKEAVVKRFLQLCRERDIRPNQLATLSGVTPSTVYSMLDPEGMDTGRPAEGFLQFRSPPSSAPHVLGTFPPEGGRLSGG